MSIVIYQLLLFNITHIKMHTGHNPNELQLNRKTTNQTTKLNWIECAHAVKITQKALLLWSNQASPQIFTVKGNLS